MMAHTDTVNVDARNVLPPFSAARQRIHLAALIDDKDNVTAVAQSD
jgi:acetylornithine deacetylase/succinyl-diaminopimelate desuccinylase-like protein